MTASVQRTAIPLAVEVKVTEALCVAYPSHRLLLNLFMSKGAKPLPADKLSMREKCRAWLDQANNDPQVDPLEFLGKVIHELMESGTQDGYRDQISEALNRSRLVYREGGMVERITRREFDPDDPSHVATANHPGKPIDPARPSYGAVRVPIDASAEKTTSSGKRLEAILFLDVSGWSKLSTTQIRAYVLQAFPEIAKMLAGANFRNTWGDGILATFKSADEAATAALAIRDFFTRTKSGIADGMRSRIALHQGEVLVLHNAIRGTEDRFGNAVHVAARLEPVAIGGSIFCTRQFKEALEANHEEGQPRVTALGSLELHKGYGNIEVFLVAHAGDHDRTEEFKRLMTQTPASSVEKSAPLSERDIDLYIENWVEDRHLIPGIYEFAKVALECDPDGRISAEVAKPKLIELMNKHRVKHIVFDNAFRVRDY